MPPSRAFSITKKACACTDWRGRQVSGVRAWKLGVTAENRPSTWGLVVGKTMVFSFPSITIVAPRNNSPGKSTSTPIFSIVRQERLIPSPFFRETLEQFDLLETVVPIVSASATVARMWRTPLSLVFIDGSHTFESAFGDYKLWSPFLIPGGYLLIHDLFFDPKQGGQAPYEVYKYALASGDFLAEPLTKTLGVLKKIKQHHD